MKWDTTYKNNQIMTERIKSIMLGQLLGDGHMSTHTGKTWSLTILQGSMKHYEYIVHLRELFDDWTRMSLLENHEVKPNVTYQKWQFTTLKFAQFSEIGNAFYECQEVAGKVRWVKKVPMDGIQDRCMTEESQAYWFMDDGSNKWGERVKAVRICTECFTEPEQDYQVEQLRSKFDIGVTKYRKGKGHRQYVPTREYSKFYNQVDKHVIPSMKYKLPRQ